MKTPLRSPSMRRRVTGGRFGSDLLVARQGEGSVVLHLRSGVYLELDATATTILELLETYPVAGAAEQLAARYGGTPDTYCADIESMLERIESATARPVRRPRRPSVRGLGSVVRSWWRLPDGLRGSVVALSAVVAWVEVLLALTSLERVARILRVAIHDPGPGGADGGDGVAALDPADLADREQRRLLALRWIYNRWPYDATCLRRSLVSAHILRRRHPVLCLGLANDAGVLAHAWLLVAGCSLGALPDTTSLRRVRRDPPVPAATGPVG